LANRQYTVPNQQTPGSGGGGGGSGTVTSVGLADSTGTFNITGSPVTTSGTLTLSTFKNQTANTVLAGPTSGGAAAPTFRVLVSGDLPAGTGTVTSVTFTGDGTVLSSTPSGAVTTSGTVTATLANAGGGTILGNNTTSSAAPAYTTAPVLGIPGTSTGSIALASSTASGKYTITAPANAATPTLTLPTGTGTFAVTASAPIVLNATTGALTAPTAVTSAASLTSNAVVLGGGGQATSTQTFLTTDGAAILTIGVIGGGNGVLALAGNTSGTATFTAPAVAGTRTNGVTASNVLLGPDGAVGSPTWAFSSETNTGIYKNAAGSMGFTASGLLQMRLGGGAITGDALTNIDLLGGGGAGLKFGPGRDAGITRMAVATVGISNGTLGNASGLIRSGMSVFVTSNFTTSGVGTALEAITGLAITVPATAFNWNFHCHLAYSQAVGSAAVAFGIQAATNNPTNIFATGEMYTAAGTVTTGVLATLATTTATNIVSGTPGATGTNFVCDLYGTCELGASANTIKILVSTATAADLVTILRGSYLAFTP
jgi:hypothetical protein